MVHTFECLGKRFMLDVESGSIFEIDELTQLLIKNKTSPFAQATGDFSTQEINETEAEINSLIESGVLFSKGQECQTTEYKGIVKARCLNMVHGCNLRCKYCFAGDGKYKGEVEFMSAQTAKNAIDFLIKRSGNRKNLEVDFFGGEPTLNMSAVKETVAYARSVEKQHGKHIKFTITTNAYVLTDELIEYFNAEMDNVVLSIDGRRDIHDSVRPNADGKGTFDKVLENTLNFTRKRGAKSYYVRGTFTAKNLDFAKDIIALNDYGFGQISLEPVVLSADNSMALKDEHIKD